jgi:hypothetical protein
MRHPLRALSAVFIVAAATAPLRDASASTSVAIPFDALVSQSSAAVFVTPVTQTSVWEAGRIFTYTDVHVDTRVAGARLADDVWVRTMGGEVGHIGQEVEGEAVLTIGRPTLLFLRPAVTLPVEGAGSSPMGNAPGALAVTARAQGQFPMVLDAQKELRVRRSSAVGATLSPKGSIPSVLASDTLHGLKVSEATGAIARAWSRLHGP